MSIFNHKRFKRWYLENQEWIPASVKTYADTVHFNAETEELEDTLQDRLGSLKGITSNVSTNSSDNLAASSQAVCKIGEHVNVKVDRFDPDNQILYLTSVENIMG